MAHMMRSLSVFAAGALLAAGVLLSAGAALDEEIRRVFVTNFPEVQRISGTVSVEGKIQQTELASMREVEVRRQLKPTDAGSLVAGGTLETDGFRSMVLSLTGQARGELKTEGEVGAILIPDEEPIVRAFEERGQMQFPLEVKASPGTGFYFSSSQPRCDVAFPRYRVFYYNTTDRTVTARLYAYMTN